jgi:hypothetical protein
MPSEVKCAVCDQSIPRGEPYYRVLAAGQGDFAAAPAVTIEDVPVVDLCRPCAWTLPGPVVRKGGIAR